MARIWLISDTHFAHENIYKFTWMDPHGVERRIRERFRDALEGDTYMYQRWTELVRPEDHVWHLGDVTMERSSNAKAWFVNRMRSLPGHKRLILGNHDHFTTDVYRDAGFEKIRGSHRIDGLVLSHWPLHPGSISNDRVLANVHGHIHQNPAPPGKYINVSVEQTNYEPILLDEVVAVAEALR